MTMSHRPVKVPYQKEKVSSAFRGLAPTTESRACATAVSTSMTRLAQVGAASLNLH